MKCAALGVILTLLFTFPAHAADQDPTCTDRIVERLSRELPAYQVGTSENAPGAYLVRLDRRSKNVYLLVALLIKDGQLNTLDLVMDEHYVSRQDTDIRRALSVFYRTFHDDPDLWNCPLLIRSGDITHSAIEQELRDLLPKRNESPDASARRASHRELWYLSWKILVVLFPAITALFWILFVVAYQRRTRSR